MTLSLIFVVSLISFPVQAVSVISSDITTSRTYTNLNQYAQCGTYNIFATNTKLLFYDSSGIFVKSWNTTIDGSVYNGGTDYIGATKSNSACTKIEVINSSYLLVFTASTMAQTSAGNSYLYWYCVLLAVDTLVTTTINSSSTQISNFNPHSLLNTPSIEAVLIKQGSDYYAIVCARWIDDVSDIASITYSWKIFPTWIQKSSTPYNADNSYIRGSTIWQNSSVLGTIYYITRDVWLGNQFSVYKLDLITGTFTLIANSGISDSYGYYSYFVGSFQEIIGSSYYFTIAFVFTSLIQNYVIRYGLARINDTYLNVQIISYDASNTPELHVYCLNIQSTNANYDSFALINGVYNAVFIGYSYEIVYEQFTINGLNSSGLILTGSIGYIGTTKYFNTIIGSSNGGLIPFNSNLIFEYDTVNLQALCDTITTLPYSATFQYVFSPLPISETLNQYSSSRPSPYDLIQLSQGITYTYNGYLYNFNTTLSGNGTFVVSSTGLSLDSTPTVYTPVVSGIILNGQFVFQFSPRVNPNLIIYENIIVSWNTTTTSGYSIMLICWIASSSQTPTPTGYQFGFSGDIGNFLVLFIIIMVPTLFFTFYLGKNGFLIGISLMSCITVVSGLMPIWFLFFTGICLVLLLFTNNVGGINDRVFHK